MIEPSPLLRRVLVADAVICLIAAADLILLTGLARDLTGLPEGLLRGAGIVLLVVAATVLWLARRAQVPALAIKVLIALNLVWAVDSVLLLLSGWVEPTAFGTSVVLVQAAVTLVVAGLQAAGLARSRPVGRLAAPA